MTPLRTGHTTLFMLTCLALLCLSTLPAQAAVGAAVPLGYPGGDDWEPAVAADGSGHVYVLWPHYRGVPGCAACPSPTALLQVSADHGTTWSAPTVVTPNNLGTYQVDTQIMVDPADRQTLYASWLQNNKSDTVLTRSTDHGQTWSTPVIADHSNSGTDKDILVVHGRDIYLGYSHQQRTWVSSSHDGGLTFTEVQVGQNNQFGTSLAGGAAIDSHGNVYYAWVGYPRSTYGTATLYVTKSADGGRTWSVLPTLDTSAQPPSCAQYSCGYQFLGAQLTLAVDSADQLYALWNSGTTYQGPERIYFATSIDGGSHWSTKVDVSLASQGVEHAFPALTTSRTSGDIRAAWMDTRNNSRWNVFYTSSTNGGSTWSTPLRLSNATSGYAYVDANGFTFPYGDYFQMAVDNLGTTHAVWGEGPSYTGPGNIWYNHP